MNLREGTRRLALLLGGLGTIAGGVLSYVYLQPILHQRDLHNKFERLADSDVVKGERKTLQSPTPPATLPPDFNGWDKPVSTATPQPSSQPTSPEESQSRDWRVVDSDAALDFIHIPSEVNKGGIGTINWGLNYAVESIETTEGETLSPTPAPARWQYLLGALLPVLGFLIPWGAIRALGWVVTGFVQPAK